MHKLLFKDSPGLTHASVSHLSESKNLNLNHIKRNKMYKGVTDKNSLFNSYEKISKV